MQIEYTRKFIKTLAKHSSRIQQSFYKRLELFLANKFDSTLNNHKLSGKFKR